MATTGTAIFPSTTQYPNTNVYPGQGFYPLLWCLYSTTALAETPPTWSDASANVLEFSVSRGRDSEMSQVDAGTATITLDNRARTFDPTENASIRPLNRWWLRSQFSGVTEDLFTGYAEAYQLNYPSPVGDATSTVRCTDEFKVIASYDLATTSPPRDSYRDVVMYDNPAGYWPVENFNPVAAQVGDELIPSGSTGATVLGAIVGEPVPKYIFTNATGYYRSIDIVTGSWGDVSGLSEFTIECWVLIVGSASSDEVLISGPASNSTHTWYLYLNTSDHIVCAAKNSGGTNHVVESTTDVCDTANSVLNDIGWYHIVATLDAGTLRLYINGVEEDTAAWTGTFGTIDTSGTIQFIVGNQGNTIGALDFTNFDEIAFYREGMSAGRVLAHYTAGRQRGFARSQTAGVRIGALLDYMSSHAPRSIRTGARPMTGAYMAGQPILAELRRAEEAEAVDAVLFVSASGRVTFLDGGHRAVSPWNTVQATFDDDGTDLPYADITVDYSDSFIANKWNVTKAGGTTSTASDATSISQYGERAQSLTEVAITEDSDASDIASDMLAKYKDPMTRITTLVLDLSVPAVAEAALGLELGDRIRVFRTPPGGGSRIDQTLFVQKVEVAAGAGGTAWQLRLGVSPL